MVPTIEAALAEHQAGRLDVAEAMYWARIHANPYDASALHLLGVIALQRQQFDSAVELISKAIALLPEAPEFHHNIGAAYRVLGRFELAEEHYRRALALKPDYAEAYFNLSAVRKFSADDPILPALESQLARTHWSDGDWCFLHFAAGKIYDDLGQHDRAFDHYRQGNAAHNVRFDPDEHDRFIERLIAAATPERLAALAAEGSPDPTPIFIVGMPRSGTTLVEQILAAHGDVFGAGELPDIPQIAVTIPQHVAGQVKYPDYFPVVETRVTRGFGEAYLNRLRSLGGAAPRIVDKLPANFLHLGLIAAMLPRAKVIHCRRDPLDTCLSCYFQKFRVGQEYSYDLEHLGRYYRSYERLMEHWRDALPTPPFELQYEDLVADQQRWSRALLDYCELPWTDACLKFHEQDRPVTTASNWQVRRPLTRGRVARWKKYAEFIEPLKTAIHEA